MQSSTNKNLSNLVRGETTDTTEESKGGSEERTTLRKLETLLSKTVTDYIQDGLTLKLDSILSERPAITFAELRQNPIVLTNDMRLNQQAVARVTSSRKKFIPTKMIALSVIIEDYSEMRKLRDFAGFKDLKTLRYDRAVCPGPQVHRHHRLETTDQSVFG